MSPIERLPAEIVAHIADLSICRSTQPCGQYCESYPKNHSAFARTSRHFYSILNPLLYRRNLKQDPPLNSCILWAAQNDNIDTLKRAHSYGADLDINGARDDSDFVIPLKSLPGRRKFIATALHLSIYYGNMAIFSYLLDQDVDIDVPSRGLCSCMVGGDPHTFPLHTAIRHSTNPKFAEKLIAKGAYRVAKRIPAIAYMETMEGHSEAIEGLLKRSEPLAISASLQYAVRKKRPDLVDDLLKNKGADIAYRNPASGETVLHIALDDQDADLEVLKLLLAHPKVPLSTTDNYGVPAIHFCASKPQLVEAMKLLLAHPNIEPLASDRVGTTALHVAAKSGSGSMFSVLVRHPGVDPNREGGWRGENPLYLALERIVDNLAIVKFLLEQPGARVSLPGVNLRTPLHICAAKPALFEVTKLLLAHPNIEPPRGDVNGATPLLYAAKSGSIPMIKLLLEQPGVNVSAADNDGLSPLHVCAATSGLFEATKLLLDHPDIKVTVTDRNRMTPLCSAAKSGSTAMFELIANQPGVDINYVCGDGRNMLHLVCSSPETEDSKDLVDYLLGRGIPLNGGLKTCGTPLYCAIENHNLETALLLLSRGADPNTEIDAEHHWGPLHHCLWKPHPLQTELVKELLATGVEVDRPTVADDNQFGLFQTGGTALIFALAGANNVECMKLLLDAGADADAMAMCMSDRDDTEEGAQQSMLAALFREKFDVYDNEDITEENVESIKEGIVLLLERGTSIGCVGGGPSAFSFASDAANYADNWSLLRLLLEHATTYNIHPDDVQQNIDNYDSDAEEVIPILKRFKEELLTENERDDDQKGDELKKLANVGDVEEHFDIN